jgi:leukotriene-A4 hydrolase
MERKVTSTLRGIDFAKIEYYIGNTSMYFGDMLSYGLDNPFSSLFPDIGDVDPEESFSGIPYEKGSQFAYYMESLIGEDAMQTLLRLYMSTFAQTAIESTDFKMLYESFVNETFENATDIINATQWDLWVYGPGLPPVTLDFRTDALEEAQALATAYATLKGESSPDNYTSFFDFFSSQKVIFVQELTSIEAVNADLLAYIDSDLNLTTIADPSVKTLWFALGIEKGYETVLEPAYIWIGEQVLYVEQIFMAMISAGNCDMAKAWLADYETFYNSYVVGMFREALADCDLETTSPGTASPTAASTSETNSPGTAFPTAASTSEASMQKVATFLGTAGIAIASFLFLV